MMMDGGPKEYDSMGREVKEYDSMGRKITTFTISMVDEGTMLSIAITCFVVGLAVGAGCTWLYFWLTRS